MAGRWAVRIAAALSVAAVRAIATGEVTKSLDISEFSSFAPPGAAIAEGRPQSPGDPTQVCLLQRRWNRDSKRPANATHEDVVHAEHGNVAAESTSMFEGTWPVQRLLTLAYSLSQHGFRPAGEGDEASEALAKSGLGMDVENVNASVIVDSLEGPPGRPGIVTTPKVVHDNGQAKSKLLLLMLEISFLGIFGMDRLYMNQVGLGFLKFLCGSLLVAALASPRRWQSSSRCMDNFIVLLSAIIIWDVADYLVVLDACLLQREHLHTFGVNVHFGTVDPRTDFPFVLALIDLVTLSLGLMMWCMWQMEQSPEELEEPRPIYRPTESVKDSAILISQALDNSRSAVCSAPEPKAPCPICLEKIEPGQMMQTLPCFHMLHEQCARMHFAKSATAKRRGPKRDLRPRCPVCRHAVCTPDDSADDVDCDSAGAAPSRTTDTQPPEESSDVSTASAMAEGAEP
eukprot:TRINITY_DN26397_c0_g1_i1.p1 TRINITY_DN26397_c0_g1~~TRINITY_DN26397_c0_g1_i1.p1  ORF type:complete len:457 (-),score=70.99 TRINITY_DN26397_c0_g1_i1:9-1379(-)